jgi:uncharacterized membrane protein YtjA (UPF0391 family)
MGLNFFDVRNAFSIFFGISDHPKVLTLKLKDFLIVAIVAGAFGFWGVAGTSTTIAKWLFVIFIILFIVSLILNYTR